MVVYFVEMARTRGSTTSPVPPPRIYMTPWGVKVRKVHGGHLYQPPSLKVSSYLALDKYRSKAGQPRSRLYEGVQKCMDYLLEKVEDRLMGLDDTGILKIQMLKFYLLKLWCLTNPQTHNGYNSKFSSTHIGSNRL